MPHRKQNQATFNKTLIALAASAALAPHGVWALDLAQSPPGTVEPYVAPNVILTLDDSTSMNEQDMIGNTKTRTTTLKEAVIKVFNETDLLPDGKIRFAWQTMGNCTSVNGQKWAPALDATSATNKNVMRSLSATHRANFLQYMANYSACTTTPTHDMVQRADQYMRAALNVNGPWASKPGTQATPYLGCRRNFHILLTDGGWNGTERQTVPRNFDGADRDFPDGTQYRANANTRVYRDAEDYTTIADWALKSWADPLQPANLLTGSVSPRTDYQDAPATETFKNRSTLATATLPKYWNPRYDPATWAHMVTYTIGFSTDALPKTNYNSSGTNKGAIVAPSSLLPYDFDGSFADYVNGSYVWRAQGKDKGHDMWHAAINGRGRFFAVEKGEDLAQAFRMIIGNISTQTEPDRGSTATSGSNATRTDVGKYVANYVPKDAWRGFVASEIEKADGTPAAAGWDGKTTANLLDAEGFNINTRLVLSYSNKITNATTGAEKGGVSFKWATDETYLSTAQKTFLNQKADGTSDALGQDRLNFIRGDRSKEGEESSGKYTTDTPFRERKSRQGAIVNSEVWYVGAPVSNYNMKGYAAFTRTYKNRQPMIYVGGNDGMLHGFSTADGTEKLAYVPKGIIPVLGRLTDTNYNQNHRYTVDGSPMTGDVDMGVGDPVADPAYVPNWHTLLVGALGAGGKGYFVLDVTNPGMTASSGGAAGNFLEANASSLVVMDKTRNASEATASVADCENVLITPVTNKEACLANADMGHIFAKPVLDETNMQRTSQIVRMNNNRWAVVMGNGYNSRSGRPVLLIQYLDGDRKLLRLVATGNLATGAVGNTTDNGLSAPRLVDINSDGKPDVAYAGDLKGNLWKFLLADSSDANWGVARWGTQAATTSNSPVATGVPLFTAMGGAAGSPNARTLLQPIATVPTVRANDRKKTIPKAGGGTETVDVGGMMVSFGTGNSIATYNSASPTDPNTPNNTNVQTLYSVLDNSAYQLVGTKKDRVAVCASQDAPCDKLVRTISGAPDLPAPVTQASLVQRSIDGSSAVTTDGHEYTVIDDATVLNWAEKKGWYLDLPDQRERVIRPMEFYDSSNIMTVFSVVPAMGSRLDPAVETCEASTVAKEKQYITLINIMDGKKPSVQIMDADGDGKYNSVADKGASRMSTTAGSHTMIRTGKRTSPTPGGPTSDRPNTGTMKVTGGKKADGTADSVDWALMPEQSMRPSWRQMQ